MPKHPIAMHTDADATKTADTSDTSSTDPLAGFGDSGETLTPADVPRLESQPAAVRQIMLDGQWRTLAEIAARAAAKTGRRVSEASARLRDLQKKHFGGFAVERRRTAVEGLLEYRVIGRIERVECETRRHP